MKQTAKLLACAGVALMFGACGGGGGSVGDEILGVINPHLLATTPIQGVGAGSNFQFDIGTVLGSHYYLADRTNASVDVFDTATSMQAAQIKGTGANAFRGVALNAAGAVDNSKSGPNGVNAVGALLYVGDVDSVKIVDPAAQAVIKTISVPAGGHRDDEGCVDEAHHLYMVAAPEADTPFVTFIDTAAQAVVATVTFTDSSGAPSAGLEACRYDASTDSFYINNDGTTANPHGELDVLPGAAVRAIPAGGKVNYTQLSGVHMYSEGNCDPTGLALGPRNDIAVGCREGTTGAALLVQIMDRVSGQILASLNAGGGDQLEYDTDTHIYYNSSGRWTANGMAATGGNCSAASPCTPMLILIQADTRTVARRLASGNNAHSLAVDPVTKKVFMPTSSGSAPPGCATCNSSDPAQLLTFATN